MKSISFIVMEADEIESIACFVNKAKFLFVMHFYIKFKKYLDYTKYMNFEFSG